ncbi:hypothetical protein PFISCL1PPCAC_20257, partial [Pristionchus fissidentatus]
SFFETLFFGEFKESNQSEITLEDVDPEEFIAILNILHKTGAVTAENVEFVLKLADKFDMKIILDDVESFLLTSDDLGINQKLRLSDQYNLTFLKESLLSKYVSGKMIKDLNESEEYSYLSEGLKDRLFKKMIQLYVK